MYPLKLSKIYKDKPWGGREFIKLFPNLPAGDANIGESWEASVYTGALSVIENGLYSGMHLSDLVELHPEIVFAKTENLNTLFPLLIKFLDIHDRLSIQVHPDDTYAKTHENESGKTESWYILKASPDAKIILGMSGESTREQFLRNAAANNFRDMFRTVSVKEGDLINIAPGTVHGTLEGSVVLYEIQQNSDLTYRIYDYDRVDAEGHLRELHIDKAAAVISFEKQVPISHRECRCFKEISGGDYCLLVNNEHFSLAEYNVNGTIALAADNSFLALSFTRGKGFISHNGINYDIRAGETWLIAAGLSVGISGELHLLCAEAHR